MRKIRREKYKRRKRRKIKGLFMKSLLLLIAGIIVSIPLVFNFDSLSFFTSSVSSTISANAAEEEDIIKDFYVIESLNQDKILVLELGDYIIKELQQKNPRPNSYSFYFEVKGEGVPYTLNINPVTYNGKEKILSDNNYINLEKNKLYHIEDREYFMNESKTKIYIPVCIKVNMWELYSINDMNKLQSRISMKYLNNYIQKDVDLSYSKKYLIKRCLTGSNYYNYYSGQTYEIQNSNQNSNGNLDNVQRDVIDAIADGYIDYVENLGIHNNKLRQELDDTIQKLEDKTKELEETNLELNNVNAKNEELLNKIKELEAEIESLKEQLGATIIITTTPSAIDVQNKN